MAKTPQTSEKPKAALDTLVAIVDQAIDFRFAEKVLSVADIARAVRRIVTCVAHQNLDEKISVENAAVLVLAKRRGLVN